MTIKEADTDIAAWRERLKLTAENLDSFIDLPAFRELCGAGAHFTGQTRAQLDFALDTLHGLREQHLALAGVLDRATALRDSLSRLVPSRQTLGEIESLLTGKSIELSSGQTPPDRRELLRGVDQIVRVSPAELMGIMLESFRFIRDGILSVGTVRERIGADLDARKSTLDRLREISGVDQDELRAAAELIAEISAIAATDPIAADQRCAELAGRIDELAVKLDAAEGQVRDARQLLAEATAYVLGVRTAHDRAVQAFAEASAKVQLDAPAGLPSPSEETALAELESGLVRLSAAVDRGDFGLAVVGLRKWKRAAEEIFTRDTAAATAAERSLHARSDLRGLFDALQAKAVKQSRSGDPNLARLSDQICTLLRMRPTPLAEAKRLVGRYQQQLL